MSGGVCNGRWLSDLNPRTSRALSQWREFPAGIQPADAQQFRRTAPHQGPPQISNSKTTNVDPDFSLRFIEASPPDVDCHGRGPLRLWQTR